MNPVSCKRKTFQIRNLTRSEPGPVSFERHEFSIAFCHDHNVPRTMLVDVK